MPDQELDPSIIDKASVDLGSEATTPTPAETSYLDLIGALSSDLQAVQADLDELRGKSTVDEVIARILERVVNRVMYFVWAYCGSVGIMIVADGIVKSPFHLSDIILSILCGSTAVAVIGLIGMVISGLFGAPKRQQNN